jgi:hypothetical protein
MGGADPRLAAWWWIAAALGPIASVGIAAVEPRPAARADRMAAIVAALRAEEARFKDVEYVARVTARDTRRKDPNNPAEVTTLTTRRVVLLGGRTYYQERAFEREFATKTRYQETSAYDGERTRTVVAGNCANIHLGRFVHPKLCPVHGLPLAHDEVSFPLSVYLGGSEAIHSYLGDPPDAARAGALGVFSGVAAHFEGEEEIDGLRCLKVRVERPSAGNQPPQQQDLWLAPERNYQCVKEQDRWHEMRVAELRERAPGVWFPARITVLEYEVPDVIQGKRVIASRVETTVETIDLAPRHEAAFFGDVPIPADLPIFTIRDGRLVGPMRPQPVGGEPGRAKLAEVARRVAAQERRYDDLEVKARASRTSATWNRRSEDALLVESREERSIARGERAYFTAHTAVTLMGGGRKTTIRVDAFDGRWTRSFLRVDPSDIQHIWVSLRRGRAKHDFRMLEPIFVHRPDALLLRDHSIHTPLADLLASPPDGRPELPPVRFRYCGPAEVDGHPCIALRGNLIGEGYSPTLSYAMFLATDRNDIPIELDTFEDIAGIRPLPAGISRCGDFREIAPGLWYPFRVNTMGFQWPRLCRGQLLIDWRADTTIESVTRSPRVDDAVFRDVVAPAGTRVRVSDEEGGIVGWIEQKESGVPSLAPVEYEKLRSETRAGTPRGPRVEKRPAR